MTFMPFADPKIAQTLQWIQFVFSEWKSKTFSIPAAINLLLFQLPSVPWQYWCGINKA